MIISLIKIIKHQQEKPNSQLNRKLQLASCKQNPQIPMNDLTIAPQGNLEVNKNSPNFKNPRVLHINSPNTRYPPSKSPRIQANQVDTMFSEILFCLDSLSATRIGNFVSLEVILLFNCFAL